MANKNIQVGPGANPMPRSLTEGQPIGFHYIRNMLVKGFPVAQMVKNLPAMQETWVGKIPWIRE